MTKPRTPAGLGPSGKRVWRAVLDSYEVSPAELETVRVAALAADRLQLAQKTLKAEGITIENRFGATIAHPATKIVHDAGATINSCLRLLDLPDLDEEVA